MTKAEIIQFWKDSSDKDFQTMLHLYDSGDYMWSLFMGHLVVEKLLKAYYISKKDENYPYSHNLLRIAENAEMDLNEEQQTDFSTITGFNLNARYDDYKQSFSKKCTPEFTSIWLEKVKVQRIWIKSQL